MTANARRFDYLREHPDEARLYDGFMALFPDNRHDAIAAANDFSGAKLIADVGGGNGEALRKILARYPSPRGIVFDRADVVAASPPSIRREGRIALQGGSFFDRVPAGADLYLLIGALHDWPDEDCARVLRTIRGAMRAGARLLIGEQILDPDPAIGRSMTYLLVFGSARARTQAEFGELLAASGFTPPRLIPTKSSVSMLETQPL
jgi:SAM-dependent methyltransferase